MQDEELKKLLSIWRVEAPPQGLLDRVVRHAIAKPQPASWRDMASWLSEQIFGAWPNGFAYRCAMLLVCVMAGAATGHIQRQQVPQETAGLADSQELALADDVFGIYN